MDFSIDASKINMEAPIKPIQPANLPIKDISEFPSEQAEAIQNKLKELDKQGKLKEEFMNRYGNNLGKPNSLANYILADFENRKHLFIEWTGIETFDDKHTIKKIGIKLNEVSYASNKYIFWKCKDCGYKWTIRITTRTVRKCGCQACGGKICIPGKNDLETFCKEHSEFMHLLDEFMGEDIAGNKILPSEISRASNKEVWWKCYKCNHEWTATVSNRTSAKSGCAECANRNRAEAAHSQGETLEHWCSKHGLYGDKLKSEFMGKLKDGTPISISKISKGSKDKVYWKCSNQGCGHEWTATPNSRTNKNSGCPACGGTRLIKGKNDLETYCKEHPEFSCILEEFEGENEEGIKIKPSEISKANNKRVWFKCNTCGKEWLAALSERIGKHRTGCPHCKEYLFTSFPEQFIYHSLKQIFPSTENRQKDPINNYEYDIVIPELNLCLEYSGYNWHQYKLNRDKDKANHCKSHNVQFLQIYAHQGELTDEQGLPIYNNYTPSQIVYKANNNKTLHIIQLQHIVKYILKEYAPSHSIQEINFTIAEQQANEVIGKA